MNKLEIVKAIESGKTVYFKSNRYLVSVNNNGTLILTDASNHEYVTWLMIEEYADCFIGE